MSKKKFYISGVLIAFLLGFILMILLKVIFNKENTNNVKKQINKNQKIQVTTSFYPLYFFASQIGGNKVEVQNITPVGAEPHDYEPTAKDIARIEKSNLLILNGVKLEAWGDKIKDNLKGSKVAVITVGNNIANQQVIEEGQSIQDPHVWLSPQLAKLEVKAILNGYIKIDSQNKGYYYENTNKLLTQLDELDKEFKLGLSTCKQSDIITSHSAFGYLGKAYGLNQVPISGLSPDEEPSSKQLVEVAKFAKDNNIKYIFFESLVSPKLSETIASEVGAKTLVLDPIEGISEGDMKAGKNYLTVMEDNLKNLKIALECQ